MASTSDCGKAVVLRFLLFYAFVAALYTVVTFCHIRWLVVLAGSALLLDISLPI